MFDHKGFKTYSFEKIPLDRDIFLMDEKWLAEYEKSWLNVFGGGRYENVGYIGYAAARSVNTSAVELSWYPNIYDRFHEVRIFLPREQFVACVDCHDYDEKPHVFVKDAWLENLYLRSYSVFMLIDAIGVKDALKNGSLAREKLIELRNRIDAIAERHQDISFLSFADSLLLKSNWRVGLHDRDIIYSYEPEIFIRLIPEIQAVYRQVLGLNTYAVLTQGSNEFYEDPLIHLSASKNHISLNSLGLPFAQLMSIDRTARAAIKLGEHDPAELYMDEEFFHSLNLVFEFQKESCGDHTYQEPLMGASSRYYFSDCEHILKNLREPKPRNSQLVKAD